MEEVNESPYKVNPLKCNKDGIEQPSCCEACILPKIPFGALMVGSTGSGKTVSMINMLTNPNMLKDSFEFVILFTGTHPDSVMVDNLNLSKENIITNFEEEQVKEILDKLEEATKGKKNFGKLPRTLFIFDDILNKTKFLKSDTMSRIATAHRHYNLSYMMLSQYYKKVPPVVRTNCHYIMMFPANLNELDKLAEEQSPPSMSKKKFISLAQYATNEQYNFLAINRTAKPNQRLRKNFDICIS